jgi:hypothetical protein
MLTVVAGREMASNGKNGANRDGFVFASVATLSVLTFLPIVGVLFLSAINVFKFAFPAAASGANPDDGVGSALQVLALNLGTLTVTAGLSAAVICLVLRLRNHDNDLVMPPSLVGPIVVVALGTALALGALFTK